MTRRRIVAALGGNALLRRGEPLDAELQRANAAKAAAALAAIAADHELVVTHGNGPQIGLLALQSSAITGVAPYPLDVLGAESEGMIGYVLEQELRNALPGRDVATLLTQVVVDPADPAFVQPTKPIGPLYGEEEARRLAAAHGWRIAPDGASFRRVVASPEPLSVLELAAIQLLIDAGVLVVCAGGGGIPVASVDGILHGVEAVIDKDLAAARLAEDIHADALLLLTDVPGVLRDVDRPDSVIIEAHPAELRSMRLPAGSMGPKAEAACRFVERTGGRAAIGALEDAAALASGTKGTQVKSLSRPVAQLSTDPDPAERSALMRLFYRNRRPTRLGWWVNRFWCWWSGLGLPPKCQAALEVRGRTSGRIRSNPVAIATVEGKRYLVSMLGSGSDWVRNVDASHGDAVIRQGRRRRVHLVLVPPEQRAAVLREYVRIATSGRQHFPVRTGAPLPDFERIAARYPVYRIDPAESGGRSE